MSDKSYRRSLRITHSPPFSIGAFTSTTMATSPKLATMRNYWTSLLNGELIYRRQKRTLKNLSSAARSGT